MTLDQLVTFRTVSNMQSFWRAADALHLSQPAVSKQIRALEIELGERLLERGRTVGPTAAGKILLTHAERLSQIVRIARDEIADLKAPGKGHLSIGASHTIAMHWLPDLLETYRLRCPKVTLLVETGWPDQIVSGVLSQNLDIGLVVLAGQEPQDASPLARFALDAAETVFVASPKEPYVKKGALTFEEFGRLPLILNHEGCRYRRFLERRFAERGLAMNIAAEVVGFELQKRLTQLGLGVSLLSKPLVAKELQENSLRAFTVRGILPRSYSCLVYRRDKYVHRAMGDFLKLLREAFPKAKFAGPERPPEPTDRGRLNQSGRS